MQNFETLCELPNSDRDMKWAHAETNTAPTGLFNVGLPQAIHLLKITAISAKCSKVIHNEMRFACTSPL